jgi:hypothetical protein
MFSSRLSFFTVLVLLGILHVHQGLGETLEVSRVGGGELETVALGHKKRVDELGTKVSWESTYACVLVITTPESISPPSKNG